MSLKVTSKMTYIEDISIRPVAYEASAMLTILTQKELHCQVTTFGIM